jgi:hypothetical protein
LPPCHSSAQRPSALVRLRHTNTTRRASQHSISSTTADAHSDSKLHNESLAGSRTQILSGPHTHTHTHTHDLSLSISLSFIVYLSLFHRLSLSLFHCLCLSFFLSLNINAGLLTLKAHPVRVACCLSLSCRHTHTHTLTRTHTHTHTHTHTQSLTPLPALLRCRQPQAETASQARPVPAGRVLCRGCGW